MRPQNTTSGYDLLVPPHGSTSGCNLRYDLTLRTITASPSARTCASLAFHRDRLVLYGGCNSRNQYGEIYEYALPTRGARGRGGLRDGERDALTGRRNGERGGERNGERQHRGRERGRERGEERSGERSDERNGEKNGEKNGEDGSGTERSERSGRRREEERGGSWLLLDVVGPPPPPRSNCVTVSYGDKLIIFGGFDGAGFLQDMHSAVLEASGLP